MGKRKTIVIVAEGAHDASLQPIRADYVKDVLTERLGLDTRVTTLGHTQRGGRPCAFDRIVVGSLRCKVAKLSLTTGGVVHSRPCKDLKLSMLCWRRLQKLLLS